MSASPVAPPAGLVRAFSRRVVGWPPLVPLAMFLLSLAAALRAGMAGTNGLLVYALDDAYIHMAVARNFATDGIWGCTPFHFSSSSSSLLWAFVLSLAYRVFGVHDAVPLILNIAFAALTLAVAERYLRRFGAPPILRSTAHLAIVVAFPMAGMVLMGMEHILHLLLTIWFAAAAAHALTSPPASPPIRQAALLCALGALLGASRYEGFFLVGLASLAFLLRRRSGLAFAILGAALLPVAVFGGLSVASGAFFLPNSLMLKASGPSLSALQALLKPFGQDDIAFFRHNRGLLLLAAIGSVSAVGQWHSGRTIWRARLLLPLLLASMIVLHAHFVFSPRFWVYRYDAYLVGFGIFVAACLLAEMRAPASLPRGFLPALAVASLTAVVADVKEGLVPEVEIAGMRNTYLEHYQAAEFIRRYYPGEVVIVNDLGAVTYYNRTRILDLVGLGDLEPLQIMRATGNYTSADVRAWTAKYEPAIAIVQLGWSFVVPLVPAEWIKVAEVEVPTHHQRVGFFAVDPKQSLVLRASLDQHYGPLRRPLGYRLILPRLPE